MAIQTIQRYRRRAQLITSVFSGSRSEPRSGRGINASGRGTNRGMSPEPYRTAARAPMRGRAPRRDARLMSEIEVCQPGAGTPGACVTEPEVTALAPFNRWVIVAG